MRKILNKGLLMLLMLVFSASSIFADNKYGLKDKIQDGVILHCFDWKLSDIQAEIPNIAKAGFTAVQTSPLSARTGAGAVWYDVYRPYDYVIGNGLGSADDLKALCAAAHSYGVKVIVDVVANHTDYPNVADRLKSSSLYHTWGGVSNWNDRKQVINGEIGMKDLDTNNPTVQSIIRQFVQDLKACGVDGIRWDAAKHIGLPSEGDSFWANVPDQSMYNYGEILDGTGGNNKALFPEYQKYISITDNTYGNNFAQSFSRGQVNESIGVFNQDGAATNKLVYWGESHDTYSNSEGYLSKYMSQNVIDRAYAIVAGNNGATALYFSRPFQTDKEAIKFGEKGSTHFTAPEVAEVNHMHNVCAGEPNYYVHENGVGAQIRKSGAILVKGSGSGNVSVANGAGDGKWLAAGTYTDKVGGGTFTVTNATISGNIGSTGIAVLYHATPVPVEPEVTFNPADGASFSDETMTVTAKAENATSAWVQVNGGEKKTFTTSTTLTVGAGVDYGQTVTISWSATGKDENNKEVTKTGSVTYKKVKAYKPVLASEDEVSVFLETAESHVKIWAWDEQDATKKFNTAKWPGDAMELVGKSADGKNVYKWTYTGSATGCPTNIIFTHDDEKFSGVDGESDKGVEYKNHGYYVETKYAKEITDIDRPATGKYVYFDNAAHWENVYCYFYKGTTSSAVWPGVKMTYDEGATHDGKTGWYKVEIPSSYLNAKFFINDGTAGTPINKSNVTSAR